MDDRDLRTRVSMQALDFAGAFRSVVGHLRIPPAGYVPELMAPDGPSTGGGSQSRQRIRLVPTNDRFPTLVVGSANVKSGKSELRSFEYVDAVHRQHFGKPVELDRAAYESFLEMVRNYFGVAQLDVVIETAPVNDDEGAARPKAATPAIVFVVVAAIAAAVAAAYVLVTR